MINPLAPHRVTHETLDKTEALLLASLERMGRNPDISRAAYRAGRDAAVVSFKAIDEQRSRLLARDK